MEVEEDGSINYTKFLERYRVQVSVRSWLPVWGRPVKCSRAWRSRSTGGGGRDALSTIEGRDGVESSPRQKSSLL